MSRQVIIVGEGGLPDGEMFVFQMVHQLVLGSKDLLAELAAGLLVDLPVPGELAALGRGVVTDPAAVGLLPGVRPPVDGEVGDVDEDLAAVLAGVPPGYHTALPPYPGLHQGGQGLAVQHQLQSQEANGKLEGEAVLLYTDLVILLFLLLLIFLVLLHVLLLHLCHLLCCVPQVPLGRMSPERDPVVDADVLEEMARTANVLITNHTNQTRSRLCNKT